MPEANNLERVLRNLDPELRPGRFVFATVPQLPTGVEPIATVNEDEGTTLVVDQVAADRSELEYEYVAEMITLRVHSGLDTVGLTAAVASALASTGISCNVVAGYFHDHLFVPAGRGKEAVAVLRRLSDAASGAS